MAQKETVTKVVQLKYVGCKSEEPHSNFVFQEIGRLGTYVIGYKHL